MKDRHNLIMIMNIIVWCCVCVSFISNSNAAGQNKNPKIEIIKVKDSQGIEREKEVRFLSGSGKTVKTIPAERVLVNGKKNYALFHKSMKVPKNKENARIVLDFTKALLNANGQEKWAKSFKTYPMFYKPDVEEHYYDYGISDNAGIVFINYRDSVGLYNIVVVDTSGVVMANVTSPFWLYDITIAPDAQILVAKTSDGQNSIIKILEVHSKYIKSLRSQGSNWDYEVSAKSEKKICITGHVNGKKVFKIVDLNDLDDSKIQEFGE